MTKHSVGKQGFTLVELSIVLVILGLLVGGVLTGQSLIRSAELRAIVTERDKFATALNAFKDKYLALPGDMPNAYAYWGTACGTNATTLSTGCNGDGDGVLNYGTTGENSKLWEHLSRAGLVEGTFDGTAGTAAALLVSSLPKSKFSQAYWDMTNDSGTDYLNIAGKSDLYAVIGSYQSDKYLAPLNSLTNGEALNVDLKTDDGRADTGAVINAGTTDCDDASTDYYSLIATGANVKAKCALAFKMQ